MNYGEELAYWYLRLNGFFPLTNFVLHKSDDVEFTSDCDVLAVRPPMVYEEVGGRNEDWDRWLLPHIQTERTLGVICEVKTGAFKRNELFRPEYVRYAARRLGVTDNETDIARIVDGGEVEDIGDAYRVIKLFVSNNKAEGKFKRCSIQKVSRFLLGRIGKYPREKYRDRMFFNSMLFQWLIETNT